MASTEAQAVLNRMTGLVGNEQYAIERFVDTLVASGDWANLYDVWAFKLNATDYLKGFNGRDMTVNGSPVHTPGTGLAFGSIDYLSAPFAPSDLETWNSTGACVGGWILSNVGGDTGNHDIFGAINNGSEYYMRHRGSDTTDVQAILGSSGTGSRLDTGDPVLTGYYFTGSTPTTRYIRVDDASITQDQSLVPGWSTETYHLNGRNNGGNSFSRECTMDWHFIGNENVVSDNIKAAIEQFNADLTATVTYFYQWQSGAESDGSDMANIAGANSKNYVQQEADEGKYIRCVVTATDAGGSNSEPSNIVGPVIVSPVTQVDPENVTSTWGITQPTLGVTADVTALKVTASTSITQPTLGVTATLQADDLTASTSITQPTLGVAVSVVSEKVTASTIITQPTLGVAVSVVVDGITCLTSITSPDTSSETILTVQKVTASTSITQPTLGVTATLQVDDLTASTSISEPIADSALMLSAVKVTSPTSITEPTLDASTTLGVDNLLCGPVIGDPTLGVIVTLAVDGLSVATSITTPTAQDASFLIPGAESRVSYHRSHARVAYYRSHSRVLEEHEAMSVVNCIVWTIGEGSTDLAAVDYTDWLDSPEVLTGTPTVAEVGSSDLTISEVGLNAGDLDMLGETVLPDHAVTFKVSGMLSGKTYRISIIPNTTYGRTWATEQLVACP
jgi:hypothetical protein